MSKREKYLKQCNTLEDCVSASDNIISGIPFSKDNVTIHAPFSNEIIKIDTLIKLLKNKSFFAGVIPKNVLECNYENVEIIDFNEIESFSILNAIPTVEGTLKIAIEETKGTIYDSNVMIFGYGRIGKILCNRFKMMGANVYCVARDSSDLTWIRAEKCVPVTYQKAEEYVEKMNFLINTVPSPVIGNNILRKLSSDCFIIDLASSPGGVDKECAEMYKIRNIVALGIPGKIAPNATAKYIKEVIQEKLN